MAPKHTRSNDYPAKHSLDVFGHHILTKGQAQSAGVVLFKDAQPHFR